MTEVALTVCACLYCDGIGSTPGCTSMVSCEECDGTGAKYRATWTAADGTTCSMTGSGRSGPDANDRALMEMVARAALAALEQGAT